MKQTHNHLIDLQALASEVGGEVVAASKGSNFILISEGGGVAPLTIEQLPSLFKSDAPYQVVHVSNSRSYMFWKSGEISEYNMPFVNSFVKRMLDTVPTENKKIFKDFVQKKGDRRVAGFPLSLFMCIGTEFYDVPHNVPYSNEFKKLWASAFLKPSNVYKYTDPLDVLSIIFE